MKHCEELREHYEEYALGALEGEERREIDAHLARGCPTCTAEVQRARSLVSQLAYLAPEASPPDSLRSSILEAARGRPRRVIPFWAWAGAAALLLFALYTAQQWRRLGEQLAVLETQVREEQQRSKGLEAERRHYEQILAILSAPGTREITLKPATGSLPAVRAYWNDQFGVVLTGEHLPAPAADRTFQLWMVPRKGNAASAGIFRPDPQGRVLYVSAGGTEMSGTAALAITDEPAGGRPQPTTKPLWVGPLS